MTTISGGAIDVQGMVSQLMQLERRPLVAIQTEQKTIDTRLSAIGRIKGALAGLQDAARALSAPGTFATARATSSDDTAVSAAATTGAAAGTHTIDVERLAQRQALSGGPWASAQSMVGGGTLSIRLGTADASAGTFAPADPAGSDVAIPIAAGSTLTQVRDAINAAGAGVSASIVADGAQVRLAIRGSGTGADAGFRIRATDTDGNDGDAAGLSAIAWDPAGSTGAGRNLAQNLAACDARFSVDGLSLSSPTNAVSGVLEGVTFTLSRADSTAELTVAPDTDASRAKLEAFAKQWNALNDALGQSIRYEAATRSGGPLQGDSRFVGLQRQLRAALGGTVAGAALAHASDAGLQLQANGSLQVSSTLLATADPAALAKLFTDAGAGAGSDTRGIAARIGDLVGAALGTDGLVESSDASLRGRRTRLDDRADAIDARLERIQARLITTYSKLDAELSRMSQLSSQLRF